MSDNPALQRFIEIKRQMSELEKELDGLKDEVFKTVDSSDGEIADEGFSIKSYKKPKYKFSENYTAKSDELKKLKKSEIDDGIAIIDGYSEYCMVRFKKTT